ncbi:hypothetical protein PI126_g7455 [Phytophthora idaei]|nr:hypothetical protein PI126_g7455 [Phytophthora idaei]
MYYVPLGRDICLWLGGVDASRSTGEKVLKEGNSVIVYPGGVPEIFRTDPNSKETQPWLYNMWNPPKFVINFFRKALGIPVLVFWGKFWWMPKAQAKGKRYGLVYGKPIVTTHTPNPTDDEVRAVHAQYVAEIERIFKQYKSDFGYEEDETLAIM